MEDAFFYCDMMASPVPFPHFWEHTVGSCHATMALRADWQQQLLRCQKQLGFKYVRFHGWLGDDMGTVVDKNGIRHYSFFNADQVCDFLLSIGMRPFVELSFMPAALASGSDTVFHYKANITPPRDNNGWDELMSLLVTHWVDRYGIDEVKEWFFEVWNEPNLSRFWSGSQSGYFLLYKHTAQAIKKVSPLLQVGGPATANNEWITEFIDYCAANNAPVDFISTHQYPADGFDSLAASEPGILYKRTAAVKKAAGKLPVYYTEWSSSAAPFDALHDQPYTAAFIVKTIMEAQGLVAAYSYWAVTDIFEEDYFSSVPFHGGFGLLNIYGIPKPAYRAFELLHNIGNGQLPVAGEHLTVDAWVLRNNNVYSLLLTNFALPLQQINTEKVKIQLDRTGEIAKAYIQYIDDAHANAPVAWNRMGSPGSLAMAHIVQLEIASSLKREDIEITQQAGSAYTEITLAPHAIACITFEMYGEKR